MADNTPDNPEDDVFDDNFDFDTDTDDLLEPASETTETETEIEIEAEAVPDEVSAPTHEPQRPSYSGETHSKKPLLFGIIGLAAIALIIWKGIGIFMAPPPPKPVPVVVAPKPQPLPPPKPEPVVVAPDPQITNKLEMLQKSMADQNQARDLQVKKLEADLSAANQNVMAANKSIMALQQQIAALTGVVQNLSNQLQAARAEAKRKPVVRHKKPAPKKEEVVIVKEVKEIIAAPNLVVYAIIPGRAWLRDPSGKTLTVAEGDGLGEYGRVVKIDANNGIVVTSTGVTLR